MAQRKPKAPLVLTGRVFCDWNCFTMLAPKPDALERGDLLVWSWSGDSKKPSSKSSKGLLRVSVFDGKERRTLKVKRTKLHYHLRFETEGERERKLSSLLPELRALAKRELVKAKGGLEVGPLAPETPAAAASASTPIASASTPAAPAPTPVASAPTPVASAPTPVALAPTSTASAPTAATKRPARKRRSAKATGAPVQGELFDEAS